MLSNIVQIRAPAQQSMHPTMLMMRLSMALISLVVRPSTVPTKANRLLFGVVSLVLLVMLPVRPYPVLCVGLDLSCDIVYNRVITIKEALLYAYCIQVPHGLSSTA